MPNGMWEILRFVLTGIFRGFLSVCLSLIFVPSFRSQCPIYWFIVYHYQAHTHLDQLIDLYAVLCALYKWLSGRCLGLLTKEPSFKSDLHDRSEMLWSEEAAGLRIRRRRHYCWLNCLTDRMFSSFPPGGGLPEVPTYCYSYLWCHVTTNPKMWWVKPLTFI